MAGALSRLGAPYAGGSLLGKETPLAVKAHQAGLMVRWGERVVPIDPRRRFERTDAALRRIDELLSKAQRNRDVTERLRKDRIVALRDREYWKEAVAAT